MPLQGGHIVLAKGGQFTPVLGGQFAWIFHNNNLRLINWSEGLASPKTFTIADADELLRSDKLFARKFNQNVDSKILDLLDNESR